MVLPVEASTMVAVPPVATIERFLPFGLKVTNATRFCILRYFVTTSPIISLVDTVC